MGVLDDALKAIRRERPVAAELGFELIGVVGSVARGEDGPQSDLDVAYDVIEGGEGTLFGLGRIMFDLEQAMGRKIGVIDLSQVRNPYWLDQLERDLVRA
jgi:predicted nucleotidyltransferase